MTFPINASARLAPARLGLLLLGLVSLFFFEQWLQADLVRLTYDYAFTVVEPQPVAGALRVAEGRPLYSDFQSGPPFIPLTYGPLTYWLPGRLGRALGLTGALGLLRLGRGQTLLAFLGALVTLVLLARQRGVSPLFSWLAPLPLLWFPYMMEWSVRFSPDAPALFLSLAGWWVTRLRIADCGLRIDEDKKQKTTAKIENSEFSYLNPQSAIRNPQSLAAGVLWAAGFFYKPTVIPGLIAYLAEAAAACLAPAAGPSAGRWRRLARVLIAPAVFGLLALGGSWALDRATGGLWRHNALDAMAICKISPRYTAADLYAMGWPAALCLALMAALAALRARRSPLFAACLASLALDALLMAKQGSNINYLMGSLALWGVAAAGWVESLWRAPQAGPRPRWPERAVPALLAMLLLIVAGQGQTGIFARETEIPTPEEIRQIEARVTALPRDRVLIVDPFFGQTHGLPILYADPYHASLLLQRGMIGLGPELERIRAGAYAAIVSNRGHHSAYAWHDSTVWPRPLGQAIEQRYRPALIGNDLMLWVPR